MNELMTEVIVDQPLALPGYANYLRRKHKYIRLVLVGLKMKLKLQQTCIKTYFKLSKLK